MTHHESALISYQSGTACWHFLKIFSSFACAGHQSKMLQVCTLALNPLCNSLELLQVTNPFAPLNPRLTFCHMCLRRLLLGQSTAWAGNWKARHQWLQWCLHNWVVRPYATVHQRLWEGACHKDCWPIPHRGWGPFGGGLGNGNRGQVLPQSKAIKTPSGEVRLESFRKPAKGGEGGEQRVCPVEGRVIAGILERRLLWQLAPQLVWHCVSFRATSQGRPEFEEVRHNEVSWEWWWTQEAIEGDFPQTIGGTWHRRLKRIMGYDSFG